MKLASYAALLLALLAIPLADAAGTPAAPNAVYLTDFHCARGPWKLNIGTSLSGIRALGKVTAERAEPGYDNNTEIRVMEFDGLRIRALFGRGDDRNGLLDSVEVTRPQWNVTADLRIGDPISAVWRKARKPVEARNDPVKLCGDADCATFHEAGGRIQRIVYSCYTG